MQQNNSWNEHHSLLNLGYKISFDQFRTTQHLDQFDLGRVITVHKDRYIVGTANGNISAEIIGNLRYSASSRLDFPAVGDWVALSIFDGQLGYIHAVLERDNLLIRQSSGKSIEEQVIAANLDYGLILQAATHDFNLNRLERYIIICHESGIEPIIVITKTDLVPAQALTSITDSIRDRHLHIPIFEISTITDDGIAEFHSMLLPRYTYCLLGSSGVGKSTLTNHLLGVEKMKTSTISDQVNKGKHTTTHRELIILPNGSIFIDTPGMRELGLTSVDHGMTLTFEQISELAQSCKYKDCQHLNESNCAVKEAVENGSIELDLYNNYLKLLKEKNHYQASALVQKRKDKILAKRIRSIKKRKRE